LPLPAFNHSQSSDAEAEYDRLRNLARQEHGKAQSCFDRVRFRCAHSSTNKSLTHHPTHQAHQAYSSDNGAEASSLSSLGKQHQASAAAYNKQASDYIFLQNNNVSHLPSDTIDLHGQYVEEAERILETRIRAAKAQGQDHLHVIVGKGNHSPGHIQKIKPMVERICAEEGLQFQTEKNEGRMYINLQGGPAVMPSQQEWAGAWQGGGYGGHQQQQQQYQQQQAWGGQQQGGGQYQPHAQPQYGHQQQQSHHKTQEQMLLEQAEKQIVRSCIRSCCVVM